jgi:SAM-dependent methyltransferase
MLEAYARAALRLEPPLADLGCGTGLFAAMLVARGVVGGTDLGLDWQLRDLRRTVHRPTLGLLRGDMQALPFADGSLGSAVSHCVLSSFVGYDGDGLRRSLAEVRRALRPGGRFVCCVATPAYAANATSVRLARRLGRERLAHRVEAWIDRRNDHTVVLGRGDWEKLLRGAGRGPAPPPGLDGRGAPAGGGPGAAAPADARPRLRRRGRPDGLVRHDRGTLPAVRGPQGLMARSRAGLPSPGGPV